MKTRERLLFMTIGGLLVLAGMIVGQFVFSTAQAQAGAQDATFKTVRCERLIVGDSLNPIAVMVHSSEGHGTVSTVSKAGKVLASLSATVGGNGAISTFNKAGKKIAGLSASIDGYGIISTGSNTGKRLVDIGSNEGGGLVNIFNIHGVQVATIQASKGKDGLIILYDRYGDPGWAETGKQ